MQSLEKYILRLSTLIITDFRQETKSQNKVFLQAISSGFA